MVATVTPSIAALLDTAPCAVLLKVAVVGAMTTAEPVATVTSQPNAVAT